MNRIHKQDLKIDNQPMLSLGQSKLEACFDEANQFIGYVGPSYWGVWYAETFSGRILYTSSREQALNLVAIHS